MNRMKNNQAYSGLAAWALSYGCVIGWGSFIMPGTTFLPEAGPVGAVIGLALAAVAALVVCINYGCMASRYPDSPSSYIFTREILGEDHGFLAIWSLEIAYLSLLWANATAFAMVVRYLFGDVFERGFHYILAGYDVYGGEVLLTISLLMLFGIIVMAAPSAAYYLRTVFAVGLFAAVVIFFFVLLFQSDLPDMVQAPFSTGKPFYVQILNVAVLSPWLYVGFETVSQVVGKVKFPVSRLFTYAGIAILCGMLTYIIIVLTAASGTPEEYSGWPEYIAESGTLTGIQGIPVFFNAYRLMGNRGLFLMGIAVFCALSTSMLGFLRASSRILKTMADEKLLPGVLGRVDDRNIPVNALLTVLVISLPMPFFGRTAIGWNADVSTLSVAIVYTYVSACALILGKKEKTAAALSGVLGIAVSVASFLMLLLPNIFAVNALAKESYFMLAIWSLTGILFYCYKFHRDQENRFGHSTIMWIMMLFLLFFSTNIWVRMQLQDTMEALLGGESATIEQNLTRAGAIQLGIIAFALTVIFNLFVTLLKRQKELDTKVINAEQRNRAKTDFLSNMSHDLRTPMNAIIGFTDLALLEQNNPEKTSAYLAQISSSGKHMLALINDVLEMSRIESGRIDINYGEVNLIELMENVDSIMRGQAKAKNHSFETDTSGIRHVFVKSDRLRLNQILMNLISNAIKYTDAGGTIRVCVKESDEQDHLYQFTVTDNGMGMSEEFAEKIFDAFERENNAAVNGIQGTGLGMAITRRIVEAMNGEIVVKTKAGEGSSFCVTLELEEAEPVETEEKRFHHTGEQDVKGKRVLLTDDMEINREMAKSMLEYVGLEVEMAFDGADALEKVKIADVGYFDVVLMDVQMPKMNGYQAAAEIRKLPDGKGNVPILAMTANAFEDDIQNAFAAGMNGHIAKPIDMNDLLKKIREVI